MFGEISRDYKGRCGNCHSALDENDKYCKYCGTERGKGKFLPYKNDICCVYGPPIKEIYTCKKCGHKWERNGLGRDYAEYCPLCGANKLDVESMSML